MGKKIEKEGSFMSAGKKVKSILFAAVYGIHFLLALALWGCGQTGNILLGILLICLYRPSLWFSPLIVTAICWFPSKPKVSVGRKVLFNLAHLVFCGLLFVLCYLLFGNWY